MAALLLMLAASMPAVSDPMPAWVIPGIARIESSSFKSPSGMWIYVDQRPGKAGELGMLQMTRAAFEIASAGLHGYRFEDLVHPQIAVLMGNRYLAYLRRNSASWSQAAAAWNVGLHGLDLHPDIAADYLARIIAAGVH